MQVEENKKIKIELEGAKEYITMVQEMKNAMAEFRKEIEQTNLALEKEADLLKKLR